MTDYPIVAEGAYKELLRKTRMTEKILRDKSRNLWKEIKSLKPNRKFQATAIDGVGSSIQR